MDGRPPTPHEVVTDARALAHRAATKARALADRMASRGNDEAAAGLRWLAVEVLLDAGILAGPRED